MNEELQALYQEVILDHNKRPHNFRVIDPASASARGHNPMCGDDIRVYITLDADTVIDVAFQGQGCAISTASASMMTDAVKGKKIHEINELFKLFHHAVTDDAPPNADKLGKLMILTGVKNYPSRVKCATLAWHALDAALKKQLSPIKTE